MRQAAAGGGSIGALSLGHQVQLRLLVLHATSHFHHYRVDMPPNKEELSKHSFSKSYPITLKSMLFLDTEEALTKALTLTLDSYTLQKLR